MRSETVETIGTVGEHRKPVLQKRGSPRAVPRGDVAEDGGPDPRVEALGTSVLRLRAELDAYPAELRDRRAAEDQLDALGAMVHSGAPDVPALRQSLLLVSAALGSVSALTEPLAALRHAVELFGGPQPR